MTNLEKIEDFLKQVEWGCCEIVPGVHIQLNFEYIFKTTDCLAVLTLESNALPGYVFKLTRYRSSVSGAVTLKEDDVLAEIYKYIVSALLFNTTFWEIHTDSIISCDLVSALEFIKQKSNP